MTGFVVHRMEAIADLCLGKMLDAKKNRGVERPYLANVNVRWGEFDISDLRSMRFEDHELDRFGLKAGDLVMCEGGEPGRCAIWKDELPGMMFQKALHRIRVKGNVDHRFLYYALLHKGRTDGFQHLFTGSTIKHLPAEKLRLLEVGIPPLGTQLRIVDRLLALDDLIDNNRRRIKLLEDSVRLLFDEWFRRFRFPGHAATAFVDGLPAGWLRSTLGAVVVNQSRRRIPLSSFEREARPGPYPYHGAAGVLDYLDSYIFEGRHLLVGEDGTVQTPAGAPMLQLVEGKFWVSNHAHVLQGGTLSTEFLYCFLAAYPIAGHVTGVAQPKLTQGNLNRIPVVVPPADLRSAFQQIADPIFEQIFVLRAQVDKLRTARDLLLPRLMSGELAV